MMQCQSITSSSMDVKFRYKNEIGIMNICFWPSDWPETQDYKAYSVELRKKEAGEPYDKDLLKVSWDRLARTITDTGICLKQQSPESRLVRRSRGGHLISSMPKIMYH